MGLTNALHRTDTLLDFLQQLDLLIHHSHHNKNTYLSRTLRSISRNVQINRIRSRSKHTNLLNFSKTRNLSDCLTNLRCEVVSVQNSLLNNRSNNNKDHTGSSSVRGWTWTKTSETDGISSLILWMASLLIDSQSSTWVPAWTKRVTSTIRKGPISRARRLLYPSHSTDFRMEFSSSIVLVLILSEREQMDS